MTEELAEYFCHLIHNGHSDKEIAGGLYRGESLVKFGVLTTADLVGVIRLLDGRGRRGEGSTGMESHEETLP